MKKYTRKIIAVVLAMLFFVGQSSVKLIASNIDGDINTHLLDAKNYDSQTASEEVSLGRSESNIDKPTLDLGTSVDETPATLGMSFNRATFGVLESIKGMIPLQDQGKVVILSGSEFYMAFPGTFAGLQEAVLKLYTEGGNKDFVLYIGTNISIPANSPLVSEAVDVAPTATTVSFTALKGKVASLVITSSPSDPTDSANTAPTDANARVLTLSSDWYFGTNVRFRNIRYNPNSIFAMGNEITLDRGSYFTAGLLLYGGTNNGDLTANPTVVINSTGSGVQDYYGGNKAGGTITGDSSVTINNTYTHYVRNLSGGAYVGTIDGNVSLNINNTSTDVQFIFAGGQGQNSSLLAHVKGNVSTNITKLGGTFTRFYGGTDQGNISGTITTNFSGPGKFVGDSEFYGGSNQGDIGSVAGSDVITSNFDSSQYSAGRVTFNGGNRYSGTITGNINNKVTSVASGTAGYIRRVVGGGGDNSYIPGVALGAYDNMSGEQASAAAEASARFKVYGDIYTEITKGIVSSGEGNFGYNYGGGMGGYIKGDTTIEVGTQGLVTSIYANTTSTVQNPANNTRGNVTVFDIVGGGGVPGLGNVFFLHGNSKVIMHDVIARWTYGGNFSGCTYGDTRIEQYGGVVDTLEGAGYTGRQIWGNTSSYLNDGQVDWFFSGGGWNDFAVRGNVSAVAEGGTINAHLGGTYGAGAHTVYGDAEILVKGGDFSGRPRIGPASKTFAGGASNNGYITGNAKLTLDLRGATKIVGLPTGSAISGGKPFNAGAGSKLGENDTKTIELNIYTDEGNDFLNGASIYGDGGSAANTASGRITVNIDAPGSTVGNFYATQYSNILTSKILRNVDFNINSVGTVNAMSGGSATDNFTNAIVNASTNKVTMNFNPASAPGSTPNIFTIGTGGAYNFTEFTVNNAVLNLVGGIKNGYSATAANHGTTYHQFGNINLSNNAGISISTSAIISANLLTARGKTTLTSPSGTGKIVITDIDLGANDTIFWKREGGTAKATENGTWFGTSQSYKVITFNPTRSNAQKITPYNFYGQDGTVVLLGDNEITSNASNGHAIAVPGTRVEFKVVQGLGTIKHNVDKVLPTDTKPLNGASSVGKDIPVSTEGWLTFVDSFMGAKLTFTPDAASESWLKKIVITRNDGTTTEITEATNSLPVDWLVPAKGHTYLVEAYFTDNAELAGRNVIINETEAAAIGTAADITTYQQISGRPFLSNDINATMITAINQPLPTNDRVRTHTVTYTAGTGVNLKTERYIVTVVRDETEIHQPSRSVAIYAQDATMMLAVAQGINNFTLDTTYTKAYVVHDDGLISTPAYSGNPIATLNALLSPSVVPVMYDYTDFTSTVNISKTVDITVIPDGVLQFDTIPKLDFGQTTIPSTRTDYWMPAVSSLIIEDSRINPFGSSWTVQIKVTDLNAAGGKKIPASDVFYTNSIASVGPVGKYPIDSVTTIWESATTVPDTQTLQWPANGTDGFSVVLDATTTKVGDYTGIATWSLIQGP